MMDYSLDIIQSMEVSGVFQMSASIDECMETKAMQAVSTSSLSK